MKPQLAIIVSSCFLFVLGPSAFAATEQATCAGQPLLAVYSLLKLPPQVSELLEVDKPGLGGVADRGKRFNATDSVDSRLPMRRFIGGGVGETCTVVVIERGGQFFERVLAVHGHDLVARGVEGAV